MAQHPEDRISPMFRQHSQVPAIQGVLIGAMAVWGMNVVAVKTLTSAFEPTVVATLRMMVACSALTFIMLWKRCGIPALTWRQVAAVIVCAVLMVYANQILFAEGLQRSTATNGALIMALSPLISALLAALVFRERLTTQRGCGIVLGFSGVAAIVLSHPVAGLSSAGIGDLMLVTAVISFATGGVIIQRLTRQLHPLSVSWAIYLVGTVLLVAHTVLSPAALNAASLFPGWWPWALVLFSGILATAMCNLIWNHAIAAIGVARTSLFLYWVPVFGAMFAALLLGETLTFWHLIGFVAVMTGTYLGTRQSVAAPIGAP